MNWSLKLSNKTVNDFIYSQGETSGWSWRKYASGVVECWRQVSSSEVVWASFGVGLYNGVLPYSLPFTITDPEVDASVESCGSDVGWTANATTTGVFIVRTGNTGTVTVNVFVRGKES